MYLKRDYVRLHSASLTAKAGLCPENISSAAGGLCPSIEPNMCLDGMHSELVILRC